MTNKIEIETDVPMPEGDGRENKYPFANMEIGHSFFVEGATSRQLTNAASHWRKRKGWSFKTEMGEKNGVAGCRIWRKS